MPEYVWRGTHPHTRADETVAPGDAFEPTESELRAFGDQIERVETDDGGGEEYCEEVKTDGEVCGRERPCPYHD